MWNIHNDQFVDYVRIPDQSKIDDDEERMKTHTAWQLSMTPELPNHDRQEHTICNLQISKRDMKKI